MMVSEKKRISNKRWDDENMKIVAAKIKKTKAVEFQKLCALNNETMNEVIQRAIDAYIEQNQTII